MAGHHVNELESNSMPKEAAVGMLPDGATIDEVAKSLTSAGIDADRLYFMQGEEGATAIENSGNFVSRLFESNMRERPVTALKEGAILLAVAGVGDEHVESVRSALAEAGLTKLHYFGRWTYS